MKRTAIGLSALVCVLLLSSCGMGHYRNDVQTGQLAKKCARAIGMENADYGTWEDMDNGTGEDAPDVTVCRAKDGGSLDEFGIWRAEGDDVREMASLLGDYLKRNYEDNRAYYDSYLPQETPKLRDAEVRVFGNYAVYAVLEPEKRELFFRTVEQELKTA